jgi:hypothetical protein
MKHLKVILALTLGVTVIAVVIAACNLAALYQHEKEQTMAAVRKCAENAILLEMIGRMKSGAGARQSFVRLNYFMEAAQQHDGRLAKSDTVRASLASLLQYGLEFRDDRWQPEPKALDSIFSAELQRNGLDAEAAFIRNKDSAPSESGGLWRTAYSFSHSSAADYYIYVSPLYGAVLHSLWGIVIPFFVLILAFSFLSVYLTGVIRRMRTLEQMKDDFTHNMTHELKTPVAVAYAAADSMLRYYDHSDEARNRQFLKIILQRLGFLSGMIENILSVSMERFKTMRLEIGTVRVRQIVEDVSDMMRLKADKPVRMDVDIPDDLSVQADPLHFGNVLSNLIDNAVKYSGDSVCITIKADGRGISVADNGVGISGEDLPFIFDKFYRVGSGDRYEAGGYGLGLFYVKRIVELFGWSIDVSSKRGRGTEFTITFRDNEER